jgi:hypothetical protein
MFPRRLTPRPHMGEAFVITAVITRSNSELVAKCRNRGTDAIEQPRDAREPDLIGEDFEPRDDVVDRDRARDGDDSPATSTDNSRLTSRVLRALAASGRDHLLSGGRKPL